MKVYISLNQLTTRIDTLQKKFKKGYSQSKVWSFELKLAHTGVRTRHNQTFGQRYVSNFCSNVAPPRARKLRWYVFLICLLKLPQVSGL